jgi:capsular exopolysaccharide synthesis family protein
MVILRRQRWWVIGIIATALVVGLLAIKMTPQVYETSLSVMLEAGPAAGGNNPDPVANVSLPTPGFNIPTEIGNLQSPRMLDEAYREAGLTPEPDDSKKPTVKVTQVGESSILNIAVQSTNPALATSIAKNLPIVYQSAKRDSRDSEVRMSINYLEDKIATEKQALIKDQNDLRDFRKARDLPMVMGQAGDRSSRVIAAEDMVFQANSQIEIQQRRLAELQKEKRRALAMMTTTSKTETTANKQALRDEIQDMEAERSVLLQRYFPDHPDVKALDRKIEAKRTQLKNYPNELSVQSSITNTDLESFDNQIAASRVELEAARKNLDRSNALLAEAKSKLAAYREMEPEEVRLVQNVENRENGIQALTGLLKTFQLRSSSQRDLVTLLQNEPTVPKVVKPNELQYLAIALLMGSFLALGFAMLKDVVDDRVADAEEIYGLTGLPSLGSVPVLPQRGAPTLAMARPNDRLLEKYRILRFNLLFSTMKEPVKSIMVTSSSPAEGKTELACNLAVAAAGEGRKVILVDANLRYPMIHQKMNVAGKPGLTDVAAGTATLAESLHPTVIPGLSVLTCGTEISNPAEFLASSGMQHVKAQLEELADLVIYDSANCLGMADAMVLSSVAESVLFVAKTGTTKRTTILRGLDVLRQANARVLGVAMNSPA